MCFKDMDVMTQDKMAVMKLNQLLTQMQTDFLSTNSSLSAGVNCSEILRINNSTKPGIPRSRTYDGKRNEISKIVKKKKERNISLPVLHTQVKEKVVGELDGLLGHLETIGEKSLFAQKEKSLFAQMEQSDEPQYATITELKKLSGNRREYSNNSRNLDEPQYSTIDDFQYGTIEERSSRGSSFGSTKDERYVLDDVTSYINKSWFSRHRSADSKYLSKFSSDSMIYDIHNLKEHSSLCRRLRSLEASVGITLKKQLHLFVKKKMKLLNVSGCVYCMYAFYESRRKEADEKAKEIRKTIKEHELLQQTLDEQKKQSDADRLWLESEEQFSYVGSVTCPDETQRYSWREGLHKSGAKSDSEQLGYDVTRDKKKKLAPLRLRRSIPLWELLKKEQEVQFGEATPFTATASEDSTVTETTCSDISAPSSPVMTSHCESITSLNIESNKNDEVTETPTETNHTISNISIEEKDDDVFINDYNASPSGTYLRRTQTFSAFSAQDDTDDIVYQRTSNVVKSVIQLNTGMQHAQPEEFVDLVNVVGLNLRDLLATVDVEINKAIPSALHKEVEMSHRVLSSDMAELVGKMKIAQKYADTTLDRQNRRSMLQAAHVLAIDAKNLYDTYSKLRSMPENSNPS